MSIIKLPIDTKSLYQNIKNDNLSGHTATVATPLKQGNSYNKEIGRLLEIKEKECDFDSKPLLIKELIKNSKSQIKIKNVFVFDKISVNGIEIQSDKQYCIYIKEEIDPTKAQFGRLKVHYPVSLKYEDVDLDIDNRAIIQAISSALKDYAFIVKSFEYNTLTKYLNFDCLIVGDNQIPYSKVFINEKGTGNKFNLVFNDIADDYDMEIISLRQHFGEIVNTSNFYEYSHDNKQKSTTLVSNYLSSQGITNIEYTSSLYPYSLYDIRYKENGISKYGIVVYTCTSLKYFNLSRGKYSFLNEFNEHTKVFLVSNILKEPRIDILSAEDLDSFNRSINSIKFIQKEK